MKKDKEYNELKEQLELVEKLNDLANKIIELGKE